MVTTATRGWPDLHLPRLPRTFVPRRRLASLLDRATQAPLTLLVAPSGAGKTLGVAGWLLGAEDATWLHADRTWHAARLEGLLDRAADWDGPPRLVVVDDAQSLPPSSLRMLDDRLRTAPETFRVLLLSRWDLPLTRFMPELLGHVTVLRGDVLLMDDEEAADLITGHVRSASPEVVEAITAQARGWCAAIVLTARTVGAAADPVAAARLHAHDDTTIVDRMASGVFATLQPRERHLLLCGAAEEVVTASTAVLLSHDPDAGEVLAGLEVTGLLVTRLGGQGPDGGNGPEARYRIHPLLAEVVRRRHAAGGDDVQRARASVVRAVRVDLRRGETSHAFDRLVAIQEPDLAADVLAAEGVRLIMGGQGPAIAAFVRRHADVVDQHPEAWFAIALERWSVNDVDHALRWMDRLLSDGGASRSAAACIRLMRARLGLESMEPAVEDAHRLVRDLQVDPRRDEAPDALLPLVLVELGIGQNWLGDLEGAEASLTAAASLGRLRNLPVLAAVAASHLAFTEYMAGREQTCVQVATEALETLQAQPSRTPFAEARARLALLLGALADVPGEATAGLVLDETMPVHEADLATRFWLRQRDARLQLVAHSVAGAEQELTAPLQLPLRGPLPRHLAVALLVEKAFLAALASDRTRLRGVEAELRSLAADGEAALVAGLREDLAGDRRAAAQQFGLAASATAYEQPASRALALACGAQILDALGEHEEALDRLRDAAAATEVRRNAVPFLGWSRQGTPIASLLDRLGRREEVAFTGWVEELARAGHGRPDIAALFAPTTASARERASEDPHLIQPTLSPREREVLNELARGATYADIAATLTVSENTVKTHVSSLYAKLAASRRSEALLAARNLNLV